MSIQQQSMQILKRYIWRAFSVMISLFIAVILVRAWFHQPESREAISEIKIEFDNSVAARHLSEAVRFKTVSPQNAADFMPDEFSGFIDWLKLSYPEVHEVMNLEIVGDYTLLYRWTGQKTNVKPILLSGHYDVVPVSPGTEDHWSHPAFDGAIVDGIVWGRGTQDDKSAVIALMEAASVLIQSGFVPDRTIYLSFGHDEELGGNNGAANVANYLESQAVHLEWSLDEGSFLLDGMFPGVDPLVAAINVAEKGSVTLEIVAKASGGHSSMPSTETAVGRLSAAIVKLEDHPIPGGLTGLSLQVFDSASRFMPFGYKVVFANLWIFRSVIDKQMSKLNFGNAVLRTTTAPTMLSASVKTNVLPSEAIATVNFRIHPRDTVESVVSHVKSVVESEHIEVRQHGSGRPASAVSDWNSPGFKAIDLAVRQIYGEVVVTPGLMIAGSDTRHYSRVAENSFRFNPMVQKTDDLSGFHGTNEELCPKVVYGRFRQRVVLM